MPINHKLQPLYRFLAAVAGLYVLTFGIVGVVATRGAGTFARNGSWVLGLRANRAFAILSIVAGLVLVVGAIIGRMLDRWINLYAGLVFLVAGMAMMSVMQTGLNILGFTMATCIVSFIIGLILFTAGLYGRVGSGTQAYLEDRFRHGGPDPEDHPWNRDVKPGSPSTASERFA